MKSYINELVDYKSIEFEKNIKIKDLTGCAKKKLNRIVKDKKVATEETSIEPGDVVYMELHFEESGRNYEKLPVTVGGDLLDSEFEQTLLGKKKDEKGEGVCLGERVTYMIRSITRYHYPEVTDEAVAAFTEDKEELSEIKTVSAYVEYYRAQEEESQKMTAIYGTMHTIYQGVLSNSDFEFDEEEVSALAEHNINALKADLAEEGKILEELTVEELAQFDVSSIDELKQECRNGAEEYIASLLWSLSVHGIDPKTVDLWKEDVETDLDFIDSYVREELIFEEANND